MSILCFGESYLPTGFTSHPATYQAVPTVFQLLLWLMSFPIESGPCTELKLWRYDLCPRVHTNDYSTYLCTVDGIAVPQQPFAIDSEQKDINQLFVVAFLSRLDGASVASTCHQSV